MCATAVSDIACPISSAGNDQFDFVQLAGSHQSRTGASLGKVPLAEASEVNAAIEERRGVSGMATHAAGRPGIQRSSS